MTSNGHVFEQWIRRFHPSPDRRLRLVCLPHAGGSASGYFALSRELAPAVEMWAVQYPGRQERRTEPQVSDVRVLARQVAEVLDGQLDGPFALFGHSMGGIVAYEVARILEETGRPENAPRALLVSGRRAPSTTRDERVHLRDDNGIADELRQLSGTDPVFLQDRELFEMILPTLRADYRAIETYQGTPDATVAAPLTALVGEDDPKTTLEEARAWERHTTGAFDTRIFPGGHFYLEQHTAELVKTLNGILLPDRTDGSGAGVTAPGHP